MVSSSSQFFDIGVNLTSNQFAPDLDQVLTRARQQGVVAQVVTGTSLSTSLEAIQLAEQHADLFATAGVHPHDASQFSSDTLSALNDLVNHPKVVAIGETGLDFNRDFSPRDQQESAFQSQLELATNLKKPVFLHQRDAHSRFHPIVKQHRDALGNVVVHCFTGTREELFAYLDLDCHIGITGWVCDKKRGETLRHIVNNIPDNRLLIETDAPYLLPHNLSTALTITPTVKKRNEPAFIAAVLWQLAACRQQDKGQLAAQCMENSLRFFQLTHELLLNTDN